MNTPDTRTFCWVGLAVFFLGLAPLLWAEPLPARPWDLNLRVFAEYDSNVPLISDANGFDGDEESLGVGFAAWGVYRVIDEKPWQVGVGGTFVQTGYLNSDAADFNLTSIAPSAYVDYFFAMDTLPAVAEVSVVLRHDRLDFDRFLTSFSPQFTLKIYPMRDVEVTGYYGIAFDNFAGDGEDPDVTSRDAIQHRFGATGTYTFNRRQQSVSGLVEYRYNDADGDNFVFGSFRVQASFWSQIYGPVSGSVTLGYSSDDYDDFTTDPKREQDNVNLGLAVYVVVGPGLTADAYYNFLNMDGPNDAFTAQRNTFGVGLTWQP